jgi:exonuclease SbcD
MRMRPCELSVQRLPQQKGRVDVAIPFVHLADVHLGRLQAGGLSSEQVAQRRLDALMTLRRCLERVQEAQIPLLLVAGDLFEHDTVPKSTVLEVRDFLGDLTRTKVFIAAGNHDFAASDSFYRTLQWPDNVHLFLGDWESVRVDELDLTMHGCGFSEPESAIPVLREYVAGDGAAVGLHVVLLHADYVAGGASTSAYCPVCQADLESVGADYVALGHLHTPQLLWQVDGRVRAAYSGALEPVTFSEEGTHGYFVGELGQGGARLDLVPAAARQYRRLYVDISAMDTMERVSEAAQRMLADVPQTDLVRLVICGDRQPDLELDHSRLQELGGDQFAFFVRDETVVAYDLESLAQGYSARAVFVQRLRSRLEEATPEEEPLLRQALKMGLDALAGREVRLP